MQHTNDNRGNLSLWKHMLVGAVLGALVPAALAVRYMFYPRDRVDSEAVAILPHLLFAFGVPLAAICGAAIGWALFQIRRPGTSRLSAALGLGLIGILVGLAATVIVPGLDYRLATMATCGAFCSFLGFALARR